MEATKTVTDYTCLRCKGAITKTVQYSPAVGRYSCGSCDNPALPNLKGKEGGR